MTLNLNANLSSGQFAAQNASQDAILRKAGDQPKDAQKVDRKKIHELAQQFESVFMEIVMKSMRSTVNKSELMDGGNAEEIYSSMLDGEYAKSMAATGPSGLAHNIERQLLENMGIKQEVSRISKEVMGRVNYSSQTLHQDAKQARIKGKG